MLSRILILLLVFTLGNDALSQEETRVSGVCLVAPRDSFAVDPMPELCRINCEWLAVVPYAFIPRDGSEVKFGNNHFWWGETPRGAEYTVALAKQNGLKVMLKPHVWMHGWSEPETNGRRLPVATSFGARVPPRRRNHRNG